MTTLRKENDTEFALIERPAYLHFLIVVGGGSYTHFPLQERLDGTFRFGRAYTRHTSNVRGPAGRNAVLDQLRYWDLTARDRTQLFVQYRRHSFYKHRRVWKRCGEIHPATVYGIYRLALGVSA